MEKDNFQKNTDNRGFTLVETMVAIFILLISITGPLVFSQNGLRATFLARDQFTAFYLAQDAMEFVKNIRDNNSINQSGGSYRKIREDWLDGLELCMNQDGCTIDTTQGQVRQCPGEAGCLGNNPNGLTDIPLNYDIDTISYGFYGQDSGFSRTIYINEISPGEEAEVTVKLRWITHNGIGVREIEVRENIYNWIRQPVSQN